MFSLAALCIVSTAALTGVGPGHVTAGMILAILAIIGFAGGNVFYNAFLPEIAPPGRIGRISGYGWAFGYVGGLACLGLVYPLLRGGLGPANQPAFRASFAVVALFFLVFALPAFFILKERAVAGAQHGLRGALRHGYHQLRATLGRIRRYRDLVRYLFAYFLFNDGIHTVTAFTSIYAVAALDYTMQEITLLFIIAQSTAFLGAATFGPLLDRIGGKPTIAITLVLWCAVVLGAWAVQTKTGFAMVVLFAGIGMGGNQAASRGMMGRFIPSGHNAEFFGFFALCGKFSAIIGPILFGWIAAVADQRAAILSLLVLFLGGLVMLLFVDERRGVREAEAG